MKIFDFLLIIFIWIAVYLFCGAPYPFHYDSVNYALAISDDFDITKQQPQPPGFFFHCMSARAVNIIVRDPFRTQQALNVIYLIFFLIMIFISRIESSRFAVLLCSSPLLLFFCGASVSQCASVPFGAWIAWLIYRLEMDRAPYLLTAVLALGAGFRLDILVFLGPVVLAVFIMNRYKPAVWVKCIGITAIITSLWYIPTTISSNGASPLMTTVEAQKMFSSGSSLFFGASLFENVRTALRFMIYSIGVLGPGMIAFTFIYFRSRHTRKENTILLCAIVPFILYGTIIHIPFPTYYAPILGFFLGWSALTFKAKLTPWLMYGLAVLNILFFLYVPAAQYNLQNHFYQRTFLQNVNKQIAYIGSNGLAQLNDSYDLMRYAEKHISEYQSFTVGDALMWGRVWEYMAVHRWHNRYVPVSGGKSYILRKKNGSYCVEPPITR